MKQALGGAAALAGVAWLLFTFSTPEPCERIARGAAPVRMTFDTVRWAAKNWLSTESRIDMIRWSLNADAATQRFLTRQFYGDGAQCVAAHAGSTTSPSTPASKSTDAESTSAARLPTPVAAPASGASQ